MSCAISQTGLRGATHVGLGGYLVLGGITLVAAAVGYAIENVPPGVDPIV